MVINRLTDLPSENELSDILVSIFKTNSELIPLFAKTFASVPIQHNDFRVYSRTRLSSIPEIEAEAFGTKMPDLIICSRTHLVVFENKRDATLKPDQLPAYIEGVQKANKQRTILHFLIAPDTSRYTNLPNEVIQVTWDKLHDFLSIHCPNLSTEDRNTIGRFRLSFYKQVCDNVLANVPSYFSQCSYQSHKPTSDYYGVHFTLPQSRDVVFSLALFLQSPSYLKLFPFKVRLDGKLVTFNQGKHEFIQKYRATILQLPRTNHELKAQYPGFVIDLHTEARSDLNTLCNEITSLLQKECQQVISLYQSLR